jgi:predicted DNA-binding WGR domain protein
MTRRFELVDGASSRFWEIAVDGKTSIVRFGKIGTQGQTKSKSFPTEEAAARDAEKLVAEKTGKGYVEVASSKGGGAARDDAPSSSAAKSKPDDVPAAARELLHGREPTAELRALWAEHRAKKEDAFFAGSEFGEVHLLSSRKELDEDDMVQTLFGHKEGGAWQAFFEEVAWVMQEADGGLMGYWHGPSKKPLEECPVVYLSNEATIYAQGRSLVDHFVAMISGLTRDDDEDGPPPADLLASFCTRSDLPAPRDAKTVAVDAKSLPSAPARFEEMRKNLARAVPSAVRVVDRRPTVVALDGGDLVIVANKDENVKPKGAFVGGAYVTPGAAFLFHEGQFEELPPFPRGTFWGAGVRLGDGRALFVRMSDYGAPHATSAVFDPRARVWSEELATLAPHGQFLRACALRDGSALLVGGDGSATGYPSAEVECFDGKQWTKGAPLPSGRSNHVLAQLADGSVLVCGGNVKEGTDASASLRGGFDGWRAAAPIPMKYATSPHAVVLDDGRVMVASSSTVAIFDPQSDAWSEPKEHERVYEPLAKLTDGRVVFLGGDPRRSVLVFDPKSESFAKMGELLVPHGGSPAAAELHDGRILFMGGDLYNNIACEPELLDPKTSTSTPIVADAMRRQQKARAAYDKKKT